MEDGHTPANRQKGCHPSMRILDDVGRSSFMQVRDHSRADSDSRRAVLLNELGVAIVGLDPVVGVEVISVCGDQAESVIGVKIPERAGIGTLSVSARREFTEGHYGDVGAKDSVLLLR